MTPRAVTTRDAGLALIGRINRWLIAGAIALTGMISLVAARSFHGRTVGSAGSANIQSAQSSSASSGGSNSSGGGLAQPAQAPSPSQSASAPVVSSGGS
jgi:hypothetical protein